MTLSAWNDRWRVFADATAFALGLNLWMMLILLPGLQVGSFVGVPHVFFALVAPLILLLGGVWRRNETLLLFGYPSALLLPLALDSQMASMQFYGPARFTLVGLSLVAFLFAASTLTSFYIPPKPHHVRPLQSASAPLSQRWRRRFRMYALLAITALIFPLVLIFRINFDEAGAVALSENYPGRAATFTTFMNVLAIALWLVVFSKFLLKPLRLHRTGDKALRGDLAHRRRYAQHKRPQLTFYVGGVLALVLMALWFAWQT